MSLFLILSGIVVIYLSPSVSLIVPRGQSIKNMVSFEGYPQPQTKEGAYAIASNFETVMPAIILVNPFLDQNVGSVARTMLNFGLSELRVVDPKCDILSNNSRALAAGAVDILENAKLFSSLKECISDLQIVMATTIRPRHMTQAIVSPSRAAETVVHRDQNIRAGILFGTERSGLTNEDVSMADTIITIPTFSHFSSLNLAQAVNIVGYEIWNAKQKLEGTSSPELWLHPKDGERIARRHELDNLLTRLESKLTEKEFQSHQNRRVLVYRSIRNIAQRVMMTKSEIDILQGVLSCLVKPLDEESND